MLHTLKKLRNNENITIHFVGDSITHGLNHCRTEETYVAKFACLLANKFPGYSIFRYDGIASDELSPMQSFDGPILVSCRENSGRIDIVKNGIGGNTVQRALNRTNDFTNTSPTGKKADITFMMFGINDALKSDPQKYVSPEQFKENYKTLLKEVRKRNPRTDIILMTATYNDQSVDEYCIRTKELAEEESLPCIDLHELWMKHYKNGAEHFGQGDWLSDTSYDACHPTPKAAYIMAEKICDEFLVLCNDT